MRTRTKALTVLGGAAIALLGVGAVAVRAQSAMPDKPVGVSSEEAHRKLEAAIAPYIEKARKTYSAAKARFLAGLPPKHWFLVTVRLADSRGNREVVFIRVDAIVDGRITGTIGNEIMTVTGCRQGDSYELAESEVLDWTIVLPDGSEEGNVVGKFLDTYEP